MFYIFRVLRLLKIYFFSKLVYIQAYFWRVEIGANIQVKSLPFFYKKPKAKIFIGSNVTINNTASDNFAGATNKTVIAATADNAIIKIGNYVGMSSVVLNAKKNIQIEDYVQIGINTRIYDNDFHDTNPIERQRETIREKNFKPKVCCKSVTIKKNAWLGGNCLILKGVTIGENSIIGANSVVTKNIPDNVIAVGNPAIVVKEINQKET